ncbi:MAG: 50S ribosomal protein L29 [Flavobacteriales bacterium]|nr:MAG: 50S ribosomal protein L29 [Flavobacteriales bacterium]
MRQSEITKLSVEDLREQLSTSKKKYTDLKMAHTISPLENPIQLRTLRRTIARMATELTKREAE